MSLLFLIHLWIFWTNFLWSGDPNDSGERPYSMCRLGADPTPSGVVAWPRFDERPGAGGRAELHSHIIFNITGADLQHLDKVELTAAGDEKAKQCAALGL